MGILLDGKNHVLAIPQEKKVKAISMIQLIVSKKKVRIKEIQKLAGLLNFLQRAIVPGRTFTRNMYDKLPIKDRHGKLLKQYHHITVDKGFRDDCKVWLDFMSSEDHSLHNICRPFVDLDSVHHAESLQFFTDASKSATLGFGCVYENRWTFAQWNRDFIESQDPSIKFLELFALCIGILTWSKFLSNMRIAVYCDNEAVVGMVNKMTSRCPQCMKLIRILALNNLKSN